MSVKRIQKEIDAAEFVEWMAYNQIDPFGEDRADLRNAITSMSVARGAGAGKNLKVSDFMPTFDKKKAQTVDEMKAVLSMYSDAHNKSRAARK